MYLNKEGEYWVLYSSEGEELDNWELPKCWDICPECNGDGKVLYGGMRGYAYTMSEFYEEFPEEEDQDAYFGGAYDVGCTHCKGSGKVRVIDEDKVSSLIQSGKLPENFQELLDKYYEDRYYEDMEREAERRMGA